MATEFTDLCRAGDLDRIKELTNIYTTSQSMITTGFLYACDTGHLHVVKYLIELYKSACFEKINHTDNGYGFIRACNNRHLHIVIYLINLYKIVVYQ